MGITSFIWFEDRAEEAAKFYVSIFRKDSRIISSTKLKGTPSGPNTYMVALKLNGTYFTFLNGGKVPGYKISDSGAVSFVVECKDQKEIDHYWDSLSKGGKQIQCGWLKDKYGITWQITPKILPKLLGGPSAKGRQRAMAAMLKMKKFDIKKLQNAYSGK